jgi:hypothetical protein
MGHVQASNIRRLDMLRFLKIALPVFLIGFVAGNAFWYLASPLWIDNEVSESLPAELMLTRVAGLTRGNSPIRSHKQKSPPFAKRAFYGLFGVFASFRRPLRAAMWPVQDRKTQC